MIQIKNLLALSASLFFLGACAEDVVTGTADVPQAPENPVIVNRAEGAEGGQLMIKFRPEVTPLLDQALTRSTDAFGTMTRSGITDMDKALEIIRSYRIERVFPINKQENSTRQAGLHLWYVVHFDKDTDLQKAAEELSMVGEIAKIQYCHEMKRFDKRPVGMSPLTRMAANSLQDAERFNDPGLLYQWHYINTGDQSLVLNSKPGADVNCAEAWKKCTGDPSIIVAVMDEGVMWAHPDLKDNMWVNEGEIFKSDKDNDGNGYNGDVYGYNFAENTPNLEWTSEGDTGHGTHVAGTIAAVNNNGEGVCGIAGGSGNNDGVKIMSIQMFSGKYGTLPYNEARGIKYAADNGAVILQCSWGAPSSLTDPSQSPRGYASDEEWAYYCPLEKEALDYFIHNAGSPNGVIEGGLVIYAAGNEYAAAAGYPGAYGDFISVVAMDAANMPATYTNYGKGVDISAPGGDSDFHMGNAGSVLSTMPPSHTPDGGNYGYMDGTSMACPHVSGVAALGLSYAAKLHKHFTATQFKEMILQSVRDVESGWEGNKFYYKYYGVAGESNPSMMELNKYYRGRIGAGMIDADKLLTLVEGNGVKLEVPNVYISVGEENRQTIDLFRFFDGGEELTYTVQCADSSIATAEVEGQRLVVTGVSVGSTSFTVTASNGTSQTADITVRRKAGGNGWL